MKIEVLKHLKDILDSINNIEEFIGAKKDFNIYSKNKLLKSAVERQLSIIGEAVNRIKRDDAFLKISNIKGIVGLRNRVIHSYDNITDEIIWGIVISHLPKLKKEIIALMKE